MNAVEIEEAVSELASQPFDRDEFPFQFLTAFGMKDTTVRRLRTGSSNSSDVLGGVLQRSNIHIATSPAGQVGETLAALRASPKTAAGKAKFILATDGDTLEAEDLTSGEATACEYADLPLHFGFFLPLAGISTVTEIKNNPIDIKATGRLNKLYVELLKDNPDWGTKEKRPALNQFMARLIFCFFAEDTGIFLGEGLFSSTVARMSTPGHGSGEDRWGNTHGVLSELFRAMATDTRHKGQLDGRHRKEVGIKSWADVFPYVNGGLFSGSVECPKFSRIARSYLLRTGELSWKEINPDIFGSMIQAVADDDERGELGMHYTSVPNILKVLNPLFLDDLREQLEAADDNVRKLRNLRKRIAGIRVFDPACGSGNFLVIAYLKMREIEHEIVRRTGDDPRSLIQLTNFFGVEIKSFAVEIARLSLLIAEFQADCRYISQQEARAMVLPLHRTGQITVGNALELDWTVVCPPTDDHSGLEHDLAGPTGRLALDQESWSSSNEPRTFVCGNPPYKGTKNQTKEQKQDLENLFKSKTKNFGSLDYVAGWVFKAAEYGSTVSCRFAFVTTNSIFQGGQVPVLWPIIFGMGYEIVFSYPSFKWSNLAKNNAGVTVAIAGLSKERGRRKRLFNVTPSGETEVKEVGHINAYLIPYEDVIIQKRSRPAGALSEMTLGNAPYDGGNLILEADEAPKLDLPPHLRELLVRPLLGSAEIIDSTRRFCIWIDNDHLEEASAVPAIEKRINAVRKMREESCDAGTNAMANRPHQFREMNFAQRSVIGIPIRSSENREYLPVGLYPANVAITNLAYCIYDGSLVDFSILTSRMHLVWIAAVCGKLETRLSYSNKMGWNTFPLPRLTDNQKAELTHCAEDILLAREAHFPKSLAELYEPDEMPDELRRAHNANDEALERIYIGRRFRNDTERLEKLFELYSNLISDQTNKKAKRAA
jgi:hypothetical protein